MDQPPQTDVTVVVATQSTQDPNAAPPPAQPPHDPWELWASRVSGTSGWESGGPFDIAFKEYHLLMEGTDKITDRRQTVNTLFVTINALFLTGVGYLLLQFLKSNASSAWYVLGFLAIAIITGRINNAWRRLSRQYARLVNLRIRYLTQLEEHLRRSLHFPPVTVDLLPNEQLDEETKTMTTRGTYSLEEVLYRPKGKKVAFGFTDAERQISRAFTISYWLACVFSVVVYVIISGPSLLQSFGVLPHH